MRTRKFICWIIIALSLAIPVLSLICSLKKDFFCFNCVETNALIFAFTTLLINSILIMFYIISDLKNKKSRDELLTQIELIKKNTVQRKIKIGSSNERKWIEVLDKDLIEEKIGSKLNDSDWKILLTLSDLPSISNQRLSEAVNLSYDGVRSSLKKMYSLFDLDKEQFNQRLELIMRAIRYSMR